MTAASGPGAGRSHRMRARGPALSPAHRHAPWPQPPAPAAGGGSERGALGALVDQPQPQPRPNGWALKIKGHFGGSVERRFQLATGRAPLGGRWPHRAVPRRHPPRSMAGTNYQRLRTQSTQPHCLEGLTQLGLQVIVDPMHGSAPAACPPCFAGGAEWNWR